MEKRVLDGLQQGNDLLKSIHSEMSVEAVEDLMEQTQQAIQYQQVILAHAAEWAAIVLERILIMLTCIALLISS